MKQLGIIDEDGRTGERAKQWRDDAHYPEVCGNVVNEVYPKELLDAVPNPSHERAQAERWFANHTGAGEAAVKRMASLYAVLVEADASKQLDQEKKERTRNTTDERPKREKKASAVTSAPGGAPTTPSYGGKNSYQGYQQAPGININLQVHISADATSDQIDQIFASMAKHIYQRG